MTEEDPALVEDLGVLCWLLKDAAWVVLCPYVSIPAALAAICIESHSLSRTWCGLGYPQKMHTLGVMLWLVGNTVWMCGELLFEPHEGLGGRFPWFDKPLIANDSELSETLVNVARAIFALGILACASCYPPYVVALCRGPESPGEGGGRSSELSSPTSDRAAALTGGKVFGAFEPDVYGLLFIGPWIAKDLFWTYANLAGALACSAVVVALLCDGLRRSWNTKNVAELIWVSGNTVWVTAELFFMDELRWMRVLACAILLCGCLPLAQAALASTNSSKEPHEGSALLNAKAQ